MTSLQEPASGFTHLYEDEHVTHVVDWAAHPYPGLRWEALNLVRDPDPANAYTLRSDDQYRLVRLRSQQFLIRSESTMRRTG